MAVVREDHARVVAGALIAGSLLVSIAGGILVVRGNRNRFVREKPDWRGFALGVIGGSFLLFALAWLLGTGGPLSLGSMALFIVVIFFGTFVWPPMPPD